MAEAPEVTLTWDMKNWITVVLMGGLFLAAVFLLAQTTRTVIARGKSAPVA